MSDLVIVGTSFRPNHMDIRDFEIYLGHSLPEDYKIFLINHNGGTASPFDFLIPGCDANPYSALHELFSFSKDASRNSILRYKDILKGRIPEYMLPIGADDTGNFICLKTKGQDCGSIYFWDHDEERIPADYRNLYRLAGSFDSFLGSLCRHTIEYPQRSPLKPS